MTDYHGRTVVVTGGTGALGRAVVEALLARGAACVVPYIAPAEAAQFPLKDRVTLVGPVDLVSESDVARVYDGVGALWAS
ncbi:MAG: short-chain dehydrogenase, partial [Alphaproteobacteria bacterium]|nr:short-chain dehydrogenase [Alphaproteobacteria bacterium]